MSEDAPSVEVRLSAFGQPIGPEVPGWTPRPRPPRTPLEGRYVRIVPLDPERHANGLFEAFAADDGAMWTYLGYGPFAHAHELRSFLQTFAAGEDPLAHTLLDKHTRQPLGIACYMRIEPAHGVIEVGHIALSPALRRTAAASEAQYLLMRRVFVELGYRRYEWKCDALNAPSRAAARRFGFRYEGTFRNMMIYRGRSRDTAWYSIIDSEWPALEKAYESWLSPENFDETGAQRWRLRAFIGAFEEPRGEPA